MCRNLVWVGQGPPGTHQVRDLHQGRGGGGRGVARVAPEREAGRPGEQVRASSLEQEPDQGGLAGRRAGGELDHVQDRPQVGGCIRADHACVRGNDPSPPGVMLALVRVVLRAGRYLAPPATPPPHVHAAYRG